MDSKNNSKWYEQSGSAADTVISTRVRLARNLNEYPFPVRCNKQGQSEVTEKIKDAVLNNNSVIAPRFKCVNTGELSSWERVSLAERHLVSPEFISDKQNKTLLLLDNESISIMINEEDHIRLQVLDAGLNLEETYNTADRIDTLLDERLTFAYSDTLGYLTQCPTNLGTGMRASVMLHLPALQSGKAMGKISENLSKLGLTLRGTYGEGSEPVAALYQLSNQISLGISEKTAIANLENITKQLIAQELSMRNEMIKSLSVQDAIYRSYAILNSARLMSCSEAMKHLSNVRMGITTKLIDNVPLDTINKLFVAVQPAMLMRQAGNELPQQERDEVRASMIRKALAPTE